MKVARFGVSLDEDLLSQFDEFVARREFPTRSEALRSLIVKALACDKWRCGGEVVGVITYVFNHHRAGASDRIAEAQHDFFREIVCSQHVHLNHNLCLETTTVRGDGNRIHELLNKLRQIKGVDNVELVIVSTDVDSE